MLVGLLGFFTFTSAAQWGRPLELAHYWAQRNPDSDRAQVAAAAALNRVGARPEALNLVRQAVVRRPDAPALRISYASPVASRG